MCHNTWLVLTLVYMNPFHQTPKNLWNLSYLKCLSILCDRRRNSRGLFTAALSPVILNLLYYGFLLTTFPRPGHQQLSLIFNLKMLFIVYHTTLAVAVPL